MPRGTLREVLAEFLGTFVLILFGAGVVAQFVLSKGRAGSYLGINLAWGLGVTMGCYVSAGVSGAHLNPAVTVALAVHRALPVGQGDAVHRRPVRRRVRRVRRRLPHVCRSADRVRRRRAAGARPAGHGRHLGHLSAALPVDVPGRVHRPGRRHGDPDGRDLRHHRRPQQRGRRRRSRRSSSACSWWRIGAAFGFNSGYAINPARDLGPRLFTAVAGWGSEVFTAGNGWWWVPIVGPLVGGVLGRVAVRRVRGEAFPARRNGSGRTCMRLPPTAHGWRLLKADG